jgi:hypothetical protein
MPADKRRGWDSSVVFSNKAVYIWFGYNRLPPCICGVSRVFFGQVIRAKGNPRIGGNYAAMVATAAAKPKESRRMSLRNICCRDAIVEYNLCRARSANVILAALEGTY